MSLNLKGLVKKVYRAFKMSVGVFVGFSSVALYVLRIYLILMSQKVWSRRLYHEVGKRQVSSLKSGNVHSGLPPVPSAISLRSPSFNFVSHTHEPAQPKVKITRI